VFEVFFFGLLSLPLFKLEPNSGRIDTLGSYVFIFSMDTTRVVLLMGTSLPSGIKLPTCATSVTSEPLIRSTGTELRKLLGFEVCSVEFELMAFT
jgi:hypothetical protein